MFVAKKADSIHSLQGNFVLSRNHQVDRIKLGCRFSATPPALPAELISEAMAKNYLTTGKDLLLYLDRKFIWKEAKDGLAQAEVGQDFETFVEGVVDCSYLRTRGGQWVNGFVIERSEKAKPANPFTFADEAHQALTADFIPDPAATIFVTSNLKDGTELAASDYFPALVFHLGYLKSRHDLLQTLEPKLVSYELKAFYAAEYALQATRSFLANLPSETRARFSPADFATLSAHLLAARQMQLKNHYKMLSPQEIQLLPPEVRQSLQNITS
jgi:hypothetical protein